MKKAVVERVEVGPKSVYRADPARPYGFQITNHCDDLLVVTVERYIDPVTELFTELHRRIERHIGLPRLLRDTKGVDDLTQLLKDAEDAYRGAH